MGERLLTWLVMRLGVVTDFDPVDFGTHAADGTLIARLLQSYAVITAEQVSMIEPSTTMAIRLRNLQHLRTWLKFLSIQMDDEMINKIAHEKSAEAVRLFYELYLCLENKQALYQIKHLRGKELYSALSPKFTVRNVPEEAVQPSKETFNPLSEPLARKATMIEWYRDKCKHIVNTIKIARLKFAHFSERTDGSEFINIPSKQNVPDTKLTREKEDVNYLKCGSVSDFKDLTYEELMKLQAHGQMLSTKSSFDLQASKNYVSVIKKRSKKEAAHKAFKSEMQRLVLTELWPKLELKKDKEFNAAISEKLLKQSQYEKQITTKLYNIRNEKKIIIENKRRLDKMELQKREEEATASFERAKTLVEDYKFEQQFDKEMNLELHRRLYKERMDMKEQQRLLICKEIVNDIADIAICAAEFRNTYDTANIPDRVWDDWKLLFLGCQPILESMTTDEEEIEIPVDKTEAILERQEALNENDLIDYICLINLFALSRFFPDIYERGESPEKLTLLGYIVHRLMSLKHPRPPLPIVPDLPPVIHAIAVIGLEDERTISTLTELLRKQNIHVIKLDFVINFCLDAYRQEAIHRDDIDTNLILTSKAAMDELRSKPSKKEAKGKKANVKVGKVGRKNEKPATKDEGEGSGVESPVQERATQTPRNIPEEDGALSSRGELGKKAFEILSIGEQIPDSLLMEMFIEFLKNTQDIRGWVLLNYPLTFTQASELEEHLLGIRFPFLDEGIETMEQIEGIVKREVVQATAFIDYDNDNYMESRLLPNPIPEPKADIPRTYLTKFISVKKKKMEPDSVSEVEGVEIIEENMCPVSAFYVDQGVYYSFYHDVFDFPTVKQLARTILEEEGAEPAPSTELFGQEVKGLEEKFAAIEKKGKPPSSKKKSSKQFKSEEEATKEVPKTVPISEVNGKNEEVADEEVKEKKKKNRERGKEKGKEQGKGKEKGNGKEKRKGKKEKGAGDAKGTKSKKEDGGKQEGHSEPGEVIPKDENKDSVKVESEIGLILASEVALEIKKTLSDKNAITEEESAKPGEDGWQYVDLEIPEPVSAYLATLWENAEDVYIKDFKEVFHYKRVHYYAIFPYLNTVKQNILNFIVRPDSKQQLVDDFQKNYNNIDDDLREDIEMKNELHCRVSELRDNLWNICDQRKKEAENERQRVINDNWVAEEMGCILNLNICCMQLEIDRCVDMLQVIQDYYVSMLKNLPMFSLINKIKVPRFSLGESEHDSRTPNYNYNSKGVRSVSSNIISGVGYTEVVVKMLIDLNVDKPYSTPFHKMVLETSSKVINYAKKLRTECMDILHREEEQILPKDGGKGKKQKEKMDKKKGNKQKEGQIEKDLESEKLQAPREVSKRLFEEWEEALWDEIERTQFRVKLLQLCMIDELDTILDQALEMFGSLHDDIAERYNAEVDSVRSLCNLICRAIETEIPIQQQLVLDQDKFYIRPDTLLFPPPPEPTSEPIEERIINDEFRIVQLGKLMEKFKEIAPDGTIPQRALVYMLEDLIVCEPEGHILPNLWYQLRPVEIANVIDRIFSYGEFVDWKDFLIYGLNFEFPTMDELLLLRQKFKSLDPQSTETVSLENYHRVRFRYQEQLTKDPQSSLRENMGMEFLYCLFQVADDAINYSALLLYFCKDKIPQKGLAKAIALCLGKRVFSSGAEYIAYKVIEDALSMQMELSRHITESATRNIIDDAVERAIQQVDGVVITEVASASSEEFQKEVTYEEQEEITVNSSGSVLKGTSSIISPNNRSVDEASSGVLGGKVSGSNQSVIEHNENDDSSMPISNEEFLPEYSIRVPYDVILTIFSVCLSWHVQAPEIIDGRSLIQVLNDVYKDLKVDEDSVYIHEFLDHPYIGQILSKVHKFKSCDIAKEIREVLNMRSLSS